VMLTLECDVNVPDAIPDGHPVGIDLGLDVRIVLSKWAKYPRTA
jgi:hypothetical protein